MGVHSIFRCDGFVVHNRHGRGSVQERETKMNITEQEIEALESAMTEKEWNNACDKIKGARGGQYPEDWWPRVKLGGIMDAFGKRSNVSTEIKIVGL